MTDICEADTDIDVARANSAKARAEARLAEINADIDAKRAQAALARSLARLQAAMQN